MGTECKTQKILERQESFTLTKYVRSRKSKKKNKPVGFTTLPSFDGGGEDSVFVGDTV